MASEQDFYDLLKRFVDAQERTADALVLLAGAPKALNGLTSEVRDLVRLATEQSKGV